jgi:putative flippase GtrA
VTTIAGQREFVFFLITGGIAAAVNLSMRIVFNLIVPFEFAVVIAYVCGMATAYALARRFVFECSGRSMHNEFVRFALVNLVAVIQVWIVSVGLADLVFPWVSFSYHSNTVAHLIGVVVPVFTSYIGHKHFSFSRRIQTPG